VTSIRPAIPTAIAALAVALIAPAANLAGPAQATVGPRTAPTALATAYAIIGTIPLGQTGFAENPYVSADDTVYVPTQGANFVAVINPGTTSGQMDDSIPALYPRAVALSRDDTVFVAEYANQTVKAFSPGSKTAAYSVTVPNFPQALAVNSDDTMIVSSYNGSGGSVSLIAPNAQTVAASVLTIFGSSKNPAGVTTDDTGNFYIGSDDTTVKFIALNATTVSRTITGLNLPVSLGVGSDDSLYALSRGANALQIIPSGATTPINSVTVGSAPVSMDVGPTGAIFTANYSSGSISRVDPTTGTGTTILTGVPQTHGIVVTSTGVIYATTNGALKNVVAAAEVSGGVSPTNASAGAAVTLTLTGLPAGIVIDDSTVQSVWWGDDTVAFTTNAGTNTVSVNVPAGSGSVPLVLSLNGGNAITAGTFTYDPIPPPPPAPIPASAPLNVEASAGDASASVSWVAPTSPGSFPVTNYQASASPGGQSCLTTTTSCTFTGLTNGAAYTFTVRALTGAGWSASSVPSNAVTPEAPVRASITITGARSGGVISVSGTTTGFGMGGIVTPWLRFAGDPDFSQGAAQIVVDQSGDFTWSRSTRKTVSVYVQTPDASITSNRVRIRR
jgi:hypothetical protein